LPIYTPQRSSATHFSVFSSLQRSPTLPLSPFHTLFPPSSTTANTSSANAAIVTATANGQKTHTQPLLQLFITNKALSTSDAGISSYAWYRQSPCLPSLLYRSLLSVIVLY
jgi:hypothetical protein